MKRVFELTGHQSGIHDVAFDSDTSHMATVSKDGTWRMYNTKGKISGPVIAVSHHFYYSILVEYEKGEDPKLVISGRYEQAAHNASIALSPNSEVIVVASGGSLLFYSTLSGQLDEIIENAYTGMQNDIYFVFFFYMHVYEVSIKFLNS